MTGGAKDDLVMTSDSTQTKLSLTAVAGPTPMTCALEGVAPLTIGRRHGHSIELTGDDRVSRDHARLMPGCDEDGRAQWTLSDIGSRHGTWLNGVQLPAKRPTPIQPDDLITITPWVFRVVDPSAPATAAQSAMTTDDTATAHRSVTRIEPPSQRDGAQRRLSLLLDCAAVMNSAPDEQALAEAVLDAVVTGAGYMNAALLQPTGDEQIANVVAHRGAILNDPSQPQFSRSLIRKASEGAPAKLTRSESPQDIAHSVMQLSIDEALCVPIVVADAVVAYLYMDNRGADGSKAGDGAVFAIGLAKLAAMAWSSMKRRDIEVRLAHVQVELAAGAEAQRWIMPPHDGAFGRVRYVGRSKPGRGLGGDFFDVTPLDDHRVAVALGDVTGKGAPASVLMTASQGYLHAALLEHGDPMRAVTSLNRFIHPRRPDSRFLTLWVGVFDSQRDELVYVDAGHGHAVLATSDGRTHLLTKEGGALVGVNFDETYISATTPMSPGARALIVSDGIIEQPGGRDGSDYRDQFGMDRVRALLASSTDAGAVVEALFDAVEAHAGAGDLADDATAVLIHW